MKKYIIAIFVFLSLFLVSSCQTETNFESHPVGYSLVDSDHVASLSFTYRSEMPNNPNAFILSVYALPHKWAQVKVDDEFDINNQNIEKLVDGYLVRYFAKYIMVDNEMYTLVVDTATNPKGVSYQNSEGIDIVDLLIDEETCKIYIEAVESNNVYIVTEERLLYDNYMSVLVIDESSHPIVVSRRGLNISYVGYNETMPEFWQNYRGYDRELANQLFDRAIAKASDPEYKTKEYK